MINSFYLTKTLSYMEVMFCIVSIFRDHINNKEKYVYNIHITMLYM